MKLHFLRHIIPALLLLTCSCSDELYAPLLRDSEQFTVSFGVDLGKTSVTSSRADDDEATIFQTDEAENASIFILAFDKNHLLTDIYKGEYDGITTDTGDDYVHFNYKVTFNRTDEKRIFHIIVNHNKLAEDDLYKSIPFSTESDIFNSDFMVVDGNKDGNFVPAHVKGSDVYWRRIEMNDGVSETTVANRLSGLKMVRNFAKVKLNKNFTETSKYKPDDFESVEWGMMSIPTMSYVAPYLKDQDFATYVHETNNTTSDYTYDELYNNDGYRCHVPRNSSNISKYYMYPDASYAENIKWKSWDTPLYLFENEGDSETDTWQKVAFLMKITTNDGDEWYYRITLADPDRNYETLYIMRNVEYEINIQEINDAGYSTAAEAYQRAPSNNISGATATSSFTNVNADNSGLRVEYTSRYILYPGEVTLQTRYIPDIEVMSDGTYVTKNDCIELHTSEPYNTSDANITEPAFTGDDNTKFAIKSYTIDDKDLDTRYRVVRLTPNEPLPGGVSTTSTIRVRVNDSDKPENSVLFRDVKFILRERYMYKNLTLTDDGVDDTGEECYKITVDIPSGMPEQLFPLTFAFEAEPDCVYPNAEKSVMVVNSEDQSLFDSESYDSFHFHREVTWDVYNGFEEADGYRKVTFYFKVLDYALEDEQDVQFAVWANEFSATPDADRKAEKSQPLFGSFIYDKDTKTFTVSKSN
jgi:hypothetical protein